MSHDDHTGFNFSHSKDLQTSNGSFPLYPYNQTTAPTESRGNSASAEQSSMSLPMAYPMAQLVVISIAIGLLILFTIAGNVFVIAAILLEKSLRTVQNYLILSLAVTDLMVAVLVMPLSLFNEINTTWYLGNALCDMWVSFDVLCCTASILHLVAIACDRYLAVSRIDYIRQRNWQRIGLMIVVVWVISAAVSIPPLFGWRDAAMAPDKSGFCAISQDLGYTLFSTGAAFYFPMSLMLILNYKIYSRAKWRIQKRRTLKNSFHKSEDRFKDSVDETVCVEMRTKPAVDSPTVDVDNLPTRDTNYMQRYSVSPIPIQIKTQHINCPLAPAVPKLRDKPCAPHRQSLIGNNNKESSQNKVKPQFFRRQRQSETSASKRERFELRREKKAARVLGIITAVFIACWLPFFTLAVVGPFCGKKCEIPVQLFSIFLWLGYINSLLNPVIYTIFNHHFRTAFNKMFSGDFCKVKQHR